MIDDAIVLAGGLGTRLQSVVADRAKPMAEVGRRPFVEWLLLALARAGVRRATLAIGHHADTVRRAFTGRDDLGLDIRFSEEPERLGTGGAARLAAEDLDAGRVLILNGDSYVRLDLPALLGREATAVIQLAHVDDAGRYGGVRMAGDRVVAFREKAPDAGPGQINAGVYLVDRRRLLADLPVGPSSLERDWFPALALRRELAGVLVDGPFLDIGTPESYRAAEQTLRAEFETLAD